MEFQGKTVEEAIETGLAELGISRDDAEITVVDPGKKKLFGSVPARVEIVAKEKLSDGQRAVRFLAGLFPFLGTEAEPVLASEDEKIRINLEGETKGIIGRRGEVIDALQVLAGAVANIGRKEYKRVVVDCGNYREEREETLRRLAQKLAAKAVRIGKRVRLEPMNPYERRIIHASLVDNPDVTTKSEGKEPMRFVVIIPNNLKPYERRDRYGKDRRYNDKKGRGGNRERGRYGDKKPYPKRELPVEGTPQSSGTSLNRGGSAGYKKGGFSGFFGTYLGNSRDSEENPDLDTERTEPTEPNDEE